MLGWRLWQEAQKIEGRRLDTPSEGGAVGSCGGAQAGGRQQAVPALGTQADQLRELPAYSTSPVPK